MTTAEHKPDKQLTDPKELLLDYLDYYRSVIERKLAGMSDEELRTSRLPSGWTPLELVKHLVYMERRWLRWGFLAEQVPQPWGDEQDDRWHVGPDETAADLIAAMHDGGRRTREIVTNADLSDAEKTQLQSIVEKIHAHWSSHDETMPPPKIGVLATLDPALIVTPPKGLEVGYVPIVVRQSRH